MPMVNFQNTEWLEITGSQYNRPAFHTKMRVEEYGKDKWKLLEPYTYTTLVLGYPLAITAKKDFVTDLASIPWYAQWLISKVGRHRRAAVPHDVLYGQAELHPITRSQADEIFLEAMVRAGVPWWKRNAMWSAVKAGGWITWNKAKKRNLG